MESAEPGIVSLDTAEPKSRAGLLHEVHPGPYLSLFIAWRVIRQLVGRSYCRWKGRDPRRSRQLGRARRGCITVIVNVDEMLGRWFLGLSTASTTQTAEQA